jgi:uncharacterized protein DUF4339
MEETWYFSRDGQRMGPFSFEQLKQMASSGVLNSGDMMLRLGEQQWVPANNVEGLFAAGSEIKIAAITSNPQADRSSLPERMPLAPPPFPAAGLSATPHPRGLAEPSAATETLPPVPGLARAAGILWCVFGLLTLVLILAMSEPLSAALVGLFGGAFIFVGIQTVGGWARDVLGNGIGSLVFGGAIMLFGLGVLTQGGPFALVGVVVMAIGFPLVGAGICALSARNAYKRRRREKERQMPIE